MLHRPMEHAPPDGEACHANPQPTIKRIEDAAETTSSIMSERGDSNSRPLRPERSTLPTALLSDCLWRCKVTKISRNLGTKDTFFLILLRKKLHVSKKLPTFATAKPRGTRPRACKETFHGVIAQLVEQRTENPCVPGSIPGDTTQKKALDIESGAFFVMLVSRFFRNAKRFKKKNSQKFVD